MNRFVRTSEPAYLQSARNDLCHGAYLADQVWERFRGRTVYGQLRGELLSISEHTCAFCAGGFAQSITTVEHFEPKAGPFANIEIFALDRPALKIERKQKLRQMRNNQDAEEEWLEYGFLRELFA